MLVINNKQIEAISKLIPQKRYEYFIKKISDQQNLWTLKNDTGKIYIQNFEDRNIINLWCNEEFVLEYGKTNNHQNIISLIDFHELGNSLYPLLKKVSCLMNIMPISEPIGLIVDINTFTNDLKMYLDEWF